MNWLILSIICSALLFLIFTHMGRNKSHVLPVIVVNYYTCFLVGNLVPGHGHVFHLEFINQSWFWPVLGMGFLFIFGFYSMGLATAKTGAAPTSVAAKMSVVIPALVAVLLLNENPDIWQILGMLVSLAAVFLMTEPEPGGRRIHKGLWLLLAVFISSGAVDTGLNLITHFYANSTDPYLVSTLIFGAAGVLGTILWVLTQKGLKSQSKAPMQFGIKELGIGVVLGLVNYASLIAILSGIEYYRGQTAWFFAVNNMGVVGLSSLAAAVFFKERIHKSGYWGLLLALLALLIMNQDAIF